MRSTRAGTSPARLRLPLWAGLVVTCTACAAQRELVILSEPSGALVRLDDTVVGTTPYTTSFDAYGTRRVTLYLSGYRTVTQLFEVESPWYADFPFDVISEVLLPFGWHDRHEVKLALEPETGEVTQPDLDRVLDRAKALRLAEPTGPLPRATPAPTGTKSQPPPDASNTPPPNPPRPAPPPGDGPDGPHERRRGPE